MAHKEIIEFSGDSFIGAKWSYNKKLNAIKWVCELPMHFSDMSPKSICPEVQQLDFRSVGQWWYARWEITYPDEYDKDMREFVTQELKVKANNCYKNKSITKSNYHSMAAKIMVSIEREFELLIAEYETTLKEKQLAEAKHNEVRERIQLFASIHKKRINPDDEGVRFAGANDSTWLCAFRNNYHAVFKTDLSDPENPVPMDLGKLYRNFPHIFLFNAELGTIRISSDAIKAINKDVVRWKKLNKFLDIGNSIKFVVESEKPNTEDEE